MSEARLFSGLPGRAHFAIGAALLVCSVCLAPAHAVTRPVGIFIGAQQAQANGQSWGPALSANGSFVAFASAATNLDGGDTNGVWDVFRWDNATNAITRVSVRTGGGQASSPQGAGYGSWAPAISADGRFVAFMSNATDLVDPAPACNQFQVYVHDCVMNTTELVSKNTAGEAANDSSRFPDISANGKYVVFYSFASNLTPGSTLRQWDVYRRDRQLGTTILVSELKGTRGNSTSCDPAISPNGRYVAFTSDATNLDPSDKNSVRDVFWHDCDTGDTVRVSVNTDGVEADGPAYGRPDVSADGSLVAFASNATNLGPLPYPPPSTKVDVFVHTLALSPTLPPARGTTSQVSLNNASTPGNLSSSIPSISDTGQYVAFESLASNLVAHDGDTNWMSDVFVYDRNAPQVSRVNVSNTGNQANGESHNPAISPDGSFVVFDSKADNLAARRVTNGFTNVYIHK